MSDGRVSPFEPIDTALLIDDDSFFHEACRRLMQRTGLVNRLIAFPMAEEALEFLARKDRPSIDVVFVDINMPRMNGFEFLDEAVTRFGKDFASLVVVMLTSSLDPRDIARARACAVVDEFANKPLARECIEGIAARLKRDHRATV